MTIDMQRAIELLEDALKAEKIDGWCIEGRRRELVVRATTSKLDWNYAVPRQPGPLLENAAKEVLERLAVRT